jgi:hypothetical protein
MFKFGDVPPLTWTEYRIPKKSGGVRIIEEPNKKLKEEQRRILQYLYECVRVGSLEVSRVGHGFIKHRGITTAVPLHALQSKVLIGADVHDFFISFPIEKVKEKLDLAMSPAEVGFIMTCCTYKGNFPKEHFPQGSPASPYLTNIGMFDVDRMIASFCKKNGMFFTRYADDMLFSIIPGMETSTEVRRLMYADEPFEPLLRGVELILQDHLGLELAKAKSHVMWRYSTCKTQALGITIRQDNLGYNAPKRKRRQIRAQLHRLYRKVQRQHGQFENDDWHEWASVNGGINFCNMVRSTSVDPEVAGCDPVIQIKYYDELERWANAQ